MRSHERIAPDDFPRLREAAKSAKADGYYLIQRNYSDEELELEWRPAPADDPFARGWRGYRENPILRLFRRAEGICYEGAIHEIVDGTIPEPARATLEVPIHHYIDANPERSRLQRAARYLELMDRELAVALLEECLALGGMGPETDQTIRRNIEYLSG